MIHARKIAMVHQNTKIAMIYKLKLPHGNFSLSPMATAV